MVTHISKSPEETLRLGEAVGRAARAGDVIGLSGDLGAGKTQFVKGVAQGLGITERIHSPTFALLNEYRSGRLPCYHMDLYRLDTPQAILSAGLDEYIWQRDGLSVIEWFDRWPPGAPRPDNLLLVTIRTLGDTERELNYERPGA